jgi:gamma-glutamyl hydrolase
LPCSSPIYGITGLGFISTVEAYDYPIYATQWHPERPQFEWVRHEGIVHTPTVVAANAWSGVFFANQARGSEQSFANNSSEHESLIYLYGARFSTEICIRGCH